MRKPINSREAVYLLNNGKRTLDVSKMLNCSRSGLIKHLCLIGYVWAEQRKGQSHTVLYKKWLSAKHRTTTRTDKSKYYLDKGITMCEEWFDDYFSFMEWALKNGYSERLDLDRIDNSKGYSPDNCRFVTHIKNMANRDVTVFVSYNGVKKPLTEVFEEFKPKVSYSVLYRRIKMGWDISSALNEPMTDGNRYSCMLKKKP